MRTLYNWTAKRAGALITVYGRELGEGQGQHRDVRLTRVTSVEVERSGRVVAVPEFGELVELATGPAA